MYFNTSMVPTFLTVASLLLAVPNSLALTCSEVVESPRGITTAADRKKIYDNLSPESSEWKRISVRDPSEPVLDSNYLVRLHDGIQKIFAPWFENRGILSEIPFDEILRLQHNILVSGNGQGKAYNGATRKANGLTPPTPTKAGRYRSEIHPGLDGRNVFTYRFDIKLFNEYSQRLKNLVNAYIGDPTEDKATEPNDTILDNFYGPHASLDVIRLPRVDSKVRVWNRIYSKYITHHYPTHGDVPLILEAMKETLSDIKKIYQSENPSTAHVLDLLDIYCYLGIHAHLFELGNFSIIMSQVNFILTRFGLDGVSHSNLDWVGLSEQFADFRAVFRSKLEQRNPQLKGLALSPVASPQLTILAHLEERGDNLFQEGDLIENKGGRGRIEGLMITSSLPAGIKLEYMGHIVEQGDTQWTGAGTYLGTWGQSRALEGVAFRLTGPGAENFDISYQVRAGEWDWLPISHNGEYSGTRGQGIPLTALRIEINQRNHR